ncbi:MAG: hypothetical protein ACPLKV_03270 [Minisyncoccia bacterium]
MKKRFFAPKHQTSRINIKKAMLSNESNNLNDRLLNQILERIQKEKNKRIRRKTLLAIFGLVFSLCAFLISWPIAYNDFTQSGFVYFLDICISHFDLSNVYFNEILISLLESLPIFGLMIFLLNLFSFLVSLKETLKNSRHLSFKFLFSRG